MRGMKRGYGGDMRDMRRACEGDVRGIRRAYEGDMRGMRGTKDIRLFAFKYTRSPSTLEIRPDVDNNWRCP